MIPPYLRFSHIKGRGIHLGICGSIAAYKALELLRDFIHSDMRVSATITESGQRFITPLSLSALGAEPVYEGMFEGEEVYAHLYPGELPEVFTIAPATANTLARIAHGLADDMLSAQALSFGGKIVMAPAMNPRMWSAVATQRNISLLKEMGIEIISPQRGEVACREQGEGRLAPVEDIYFWTLRAISPSDLKGERVLITLGPTREFWDPVRFWSNPSSGKMGSALATAAWLKDAEVVCVCGPCDVYLPPQVEVIHVTTAREMYEACVDLWGGCTIACLCAAVCDFRPCEPKEEKFKKDSITGPLTIEFELNPDILKTLGARKRSHQRLIGFAAESSSHFEDLAREKLVNKNLDLIVANQINQKNSGFEWDTNSVTIIDKSKRAITMENMSKADVAWKIWELISLA